MEKIQNRQLCNVVEAALMASAEPLKLEQLAALFKDESAPPSKDELRAALKQLEHDYRERGVELKEVASGFRIQVRDDYAIQIKRLFEERTPRYSRALLETLAIIAYRQPLTRAEIEEIRGVSVSAGIIRTLQERNWIRVVGQRDVPGKPELLATSKTFLDDFNLKKISELPTLEKTDGAGELEADLFMRLEKEAAATGDGAFIAVNDGDGGR